LTIRPYRLRESRRSICLPSAVPSQIRVVAARAARICERENEIIKTRCDERGERGIYEKEEGGELYDARCRRRQRNVRNEILGDPFAPSPHSFLAHSHTLTHTRAFSLSLSLSLSLSPSLPPSHSLFLQERGSIESDFMLVAGNIKSHLSTFYVGRLIISDN